MDKISASSPTAIPNKSKNSKTTLKKINKNVRENLKDTFSFLSATAVAGATSSLLVGNSKRVTGVFEKLLSNIDTKLENISITSKENTKTLKETLSNTIISKKFNNLSTPAKAGILGMLAFGALTLPIFKSIQQIKTGYRIGKSENDK